MTLGVLYTVRVWTMAEINLESGHPLTLLRYYDIMFDRCLKLPPASGTFLISTS